MTPQSRRAVFLDKDGTLVEDIPFNVDPDRIRLAAGAARALPLLRSLGFRLFVISNQSGVARGMFEESALEAVRRRLIDLTSEVGAPLDGFYYCPHHPDGTVPQYSIRCGCRKPAPGLIRKAASEHGIHLESSWFVGDILDDVEAGLRAGCRTVLIDNGNETQWDWSDWRQPDYEAARLDEAAEFIAATWASSTSRPGHTRARR